MSDEDGEPTQPEKLAEAASIRDQQVSPATARDRLGALLRDGDAEVRAAAAAALGSWVVDPALLRLALDAVKDPAHAVREQALRSLGRAVAEADLLGAVPEAPDPALAAEARTIITRTALDANAAPGPRWAALEGIGPLAAGELRALLGQALAGEHGPAARRAALVAAGRSGDAAAFGAAIVAALPARERDVALAALTAAGEAGVAAARPTLLEHLKGNDIAAARRAAEALGRLGGPGVAAALRDAIEATGTDDEVREAANQALTDLEVLEHLTAEQA